MHVYAPRAGPAVEAYRDFAQIHVAPYERLMMPTSPRSFVATARALARDVRTFRKLFRAAGIDTVICATTVTPGAALAARSLGLPCIVYCGELFDDNGVGSRARRLASRAMLATVPRIADLVICCSDRVAAQFTTGARAEVVRLYPPIDRGGPAVEKAEARAAFGLPPTGPLIATIGSLSPARGQDVAISALGLMPRGPGGAVLAIAGAVGDAASDATYAESLRELAAASDLASAVYFLGAVDDVALLLDAADVFVNPARFAEPFGRAALEALARGVPPVVTRTGAQTELLRDGHSALVVPPEQPESLARAVERLLDSPALAARLVDGGGDALAEVDPEVDRSRFRQLLGDLG